MQFYTGNIFCSRVRSAVFIQFFDGSISVIALHSSVFTLYPIIKIPISSRGRVVFLCGMNTKTKWVTLMLHLAGVITIKYFELSCRIYYYRRYWKLYVKEFRHAQHNYVSKVSIFGPLYWPPSELYTRTRERNYTVVYITLEKEISSFT